MPRTVRGQQLAELARVEVLVPGVPVRRVACVRALVLEQAGDMALIAEAEIQPLERALHLPALIHRVDVRRRQRREQLLLDGGVRVLPIREAPARLTDLVPDEAQHLDELGAGAIGRRPRFAEQLLPRRRRAGRSRRPHE